MQTHPIDLYHKLEFDRILHTLAGYCMGSIGIEYIEQLAPSTEKAVIEQQLTETWEMQRSFVERNPFPNRSYQTILEDVKLLRIPDFVLNEEALQRIQIVMQNMYAINQFFRLKKDAYPALFQIVRAINFDDALYLALRKIIDEEGNVRPDASPELSKIRRAIISKRKELDTRFRSVIANYNNKGFLAETGETIRNGRRVLAVLAEYKRSVKGIWHDESTSGRTTYIEPEEVIEINNDISNLEAEERREIWRILRDLCRLMQPYAELIGDYQHAIGKYDFIQAKAQLGLRLNSTMPTIIDSPTIQLRKAIHPVLFMKNQAEKKKTVPFTLTFQDPNRILILSGPNAGGKSIAMKAVGLIQLMVQSGLTVPAADGTEIGIFHQIFADIGDSQSLDDDLSTYSSRLQLGKFMLDNANERTLVLIDEFGSGTDPKIGGSIAESALKRLNEIGVSGVITTHYSNLKLFAYKTKGLLNGCMLFDMNALTPTYEMKVGRPGSSFAFEMAIKNGWQENWLDYARKRTGENETAVDQLLVDLQREKQELTEKLESVSDREKKLDRLIKQYENTFRDLETMRKRAKMVEKEQEVQQTTKQNKEIEKLIREIQEERNIEKAKALAAQIKEDRAKQQAALTELNETLYYKDEKKLLKETDISKGDYVRMRNGGAMGIVEDIKKSEAVVQMGMMRMTVKVRDLEKVDAPLKQDKGRVSANLETSVRFSNQLDVRGMRREEVIIEVQNFIDEALLSGDDTLRIVHGKGDGVLRTAVKQKLREYRSISRIYHPEENAGGDGVTMVDF